MKNKNNKSFAGFTLQQQHILLQKAGYKGPLNQAEMDKFIASSPSAQATLGRATEMAQNRFKKAPVQMNEGGLTPTQANQNLDTAQEAQAAAQVAAATNPTDETAQALQDAQEATTVASSAQNTVSVPTATEAHAKIQTDPSTFVTPANVAEIVGTSDQEVAEGTGQQGEVEGPT